MNHLLNLFIAKDKLSHLFNEPFMVANFSKLNSTIRRMIKLSKRQVKINLYILCIDMYKIKLYRIKLMRMILQI